MCNSLSTPEMKCDHKFTVVSCSALRCSVVNLIYRNSETHYKIDEDSDCTQLQNVLQHHSWYFQPLYPSPKNMVEFHSSSFKLERPTYKHMTKHKFMCTSAVMFVCNKTLSTITVPVFLCFVQIQRKNTNFLFKSVINSFSGAAKGRRCVEMDETWSCPALSL